ncbi:hypothetical protein GQ53DRAFT_855393 [Thozetella sp. PMI_491]|nr:hypothetical protein GQ53DRAFT_855393 [Thozetella sp. PMI_491]
MDDPVGIKLRDPFIFKRAEEFYSDIDTLDTEVIHPSVAYYDHSDQVLPSGEKNPTCGHGAIFRLKQNGKADVFLLIQFMRPKVWRIRCDPSNTSPTDFTDYNTRRTVVKDTLTSLIDTLDAAEGLQWVVEIVEDPQYYVLQSVYVSSTDGTRIVGVQLWIQRHPFQITAVRSLDGLLPAEQLPQLQNANVIKDQLKLPTGTDSQPAVIWRTKPNGLISKGMATVLSIEKPITADYMGFGEQGGKGMFKKNTFINYFNFDNMRYQNVYGQGPLDTREPLYHSEPYFIEVDGQPGYRSQVATFIDNYSHVCIDLGKTDQTTLRVGTRFNSFQAIFVAGNSVQEVIQLYTSIVGKPKLKPRYTLGYHQGCYGYDTEDMIRYSVDQYRKHNFPLDGMHIDVDMQDDYRTFTIDTRAGHFPDPVNMFANLRNQGVKCTTNITPYINSIPSDTYSTLNEGLANSYFIKDIRDLDPTAPTASQQRYLEFGGGNSYFTAPITDRAPYWDGDSYDFEQNFNSGKPFHGGVYYGWGNGHPGHYPNLNNKEVREWWGKQYKYLFECGLDFVWQDMTSPCIAEQYGDMKSLPFRLKLDSDGWSGDPKAAQQKRAIEIWSLFSYNLHKATYHGLNSLSDGNPNLAWRANRRNFIVGRGSFSGSHRFAGLWTGDNASTWEFLEISVAQVLALGLSGVTIAGADVGGFEMKDTERYASPELIVRWYGAYSLLPWFRNHYTRWRAWFDGPHAGSDPNNPVMRKDGKWFQEPYAFQEHYDEHSGDYSGEEADIYKAVLPACRYLIRLRYSLMQLLYDAMFENIITGLPIARAMVITDELDRSLFSADYLVRNDLLVAPLLRPESAKANLPENERSNHVVYLPYPDDWYAMNLRPDDPLGVALLRKVQGGSRITYYCPIRYQDDELPYITPMYIREGAIIPKIEPRDYVPDPSLPKQPPNPITVHIYPGKDNTYDMYLDDGISRDSAPSQYLCGNTVQPGDSNGLPTKRVPGADKKAADKFCHVVIQQIARSVAINSPWNRYDGDLGELIGRQYTLIFWHEPGIALGAVKVDSGGTNAESNVNQAIGATIVTMPIADAHTTQGVDIEVSYPA